MVLKVERFVGIDFIATPQSVLQKIMAYGYVCFS